MRQPSKPTRAASSALEDDAAKGQIRQANENRILGAAEKVFRGGVDPIELYISIAALGFFYMSNRHTLSTIFGENLSAP